MIYILIFTYYGTWYVTRTAHQTQIHTLNTTKPISISRLPRPGGHVRNRNPGISQQSMNLLQLHLSLSYNNPELELYTNYSTKKF